MISDMGGYQYKREPLTEDEANRLANACSTHQEKDRIVMLPTSSPSA